MKKVMMPIRREFLTLKKFLCERGDDFEYYSSGTIDRIKHKDREYISVDLVDSAGKGFHLSRIFRKDIDNWLSKNTITEKWGNNYKEQMFNLGAIDKVIGVPCVAVDINDCYWKTAYKLGYITEETYIIGKKKPNWKTGRNACIGALCKTEYFVPYFKGKPNYKRRQAIRTPEGYQHIRNHIIGYVYESFFRLYGEMGDNFYMFLTDCVFTTPNKQQYVEKFFKNDGYKVKSKPIEFLGVDRKKKEVWWHDFTSFNKGSMGNLLDKGVDRYYSYANHQIIDGVLQPMTNKKVIKNNS